MLLLWFAIFCQLRQAHPPTILLLVRMEMNATEKHLYLTAWPPNDPIFCAALGHVSWIKLMN